MMELDVYNSQNQKVGTVQLNQEIFEKKVKPSTIHEAVVMQRNSLRQGTASTKTRGLVRGGGKKPWRQKGTGRARHGSIRSPIWRGGGIVFGPHPRAYATTIPRKKFHAAFYGALASKIREGVVTVIEPIELEQPKTKEMAQILSGLKLVKRTLFIVHQRDKTVELSCRNLSNLRLVTVGRVSPYDLVSHPHILITEPALSILNRSVA